VSQYFVVHLTGVDARAEEFLSNNAFDWGALGMSEVLPFEQPEGEEDVFTKIPDKRDIDVYFDKLPAPGFLELVRSRFPHIGLKVKGEENKDWLAEWKKGFKPFSLVNGHWVVPSWLEAPAEATHPILVDPGMAFGTGTHETTQLVAEFLYGLKPFSSVLDVGTGTGILAILAKQLGAAQVAATEIEADSRRVARENFELNKVNVEMDGRQVGELNNRYDVVVANIIDGVLVRIQDDLKARVKAGGWLVLSGIITEREKDFLSGFKAEWSARKQKGDWLLYAAKI
jgi:ribosomal protein L11 methyltransferase